MTTRLFINTYWETNEERRKELVDAYNNHAFVNFIDEVWEINDLGFPVHGHAFKNYRVFKMSTRPTYSDFINLANVVSRAGDICIIANADIYFDNTIEKVKDMGQNEVYALSRIDMTEKGTKPFFRADSQDAWIFRAHTVDIEARFTMGVPGCDNRIARIFADAGYELSNPCKSINAFHLHNSNYRSYLMPENRKERVSGPYLLLPPTTL